MSRFARSTPLFFEERVALARKALNEQSLDWADKLGDASPEFNQWVCDVMAVLQGDRPAAKRLGVLK